MEKETFDFIKYWTINFFRLTENNDFGYLDEKIESIKSVENDNEYSGMFILSRLHVLSRRHIIHKSTPVSVLSYVSDNSKDLNDELLEYEDLTKSVERYRKLKKVLSN